MIQKKVCLLGAFSVGKTSLVRRFVEGAFSDKYLTTIGVKIDKAVVDVEGTSVNLLLWDLAGEDDFENIPPAYLRGASGYLLVVDQTRPATLDTALGIREMVLAAIGDVPSLMLVNKADLREEHDLDPERIASETGLDVRPTSAKLGVGVEEAFEDLARAMIGAPGLVRGDAPAGPVVQRDAAHEASSTEHDTSTGTRLMADLGILALRRVSQGAFVRLGGAPAWVGDLYPDALADDALIRPAMRFPFLAQFLIDAEEVWSGELPGRLDSGIWTEGHDPETESGFDASALLIEGAELLVLRYAGAALAEKRAVLQRAREHLLAHEQVALENERLAELDALRSEFVTMASHELRTPLTSIMGYSEKLIEAGTLGPEEASCVEVIQRNARRLLRLAGDILVIARGDEVGLDLALAPTRLDELVNAAVEAARPIAVQHGVDLLAVDVEPVSLASADPARLSQVVDNLISNAVKFSAEGGKVRVSLRSVDGMALVEVRDDGMGMAPEEAARMFERFYRAPTAAKRGIPGTGLGLVVVRRIVDAHGGTIDVTSAPGEGTTVRVALPLVGPDPSDWSLSAAG